MPIIQSCCCWRSLRRGCYASAIYTMVYFSVTIVTMGHFIEMEQRYLNGDMTEPESESFLEPEKITPIVTIWRIKPCMPRQRIIMTVPDVFAVHLTVSLNITLLACSTIGLLGCVLLIFGVYKDLKYMLLPWVVAMGMETLVEIVNLFYLFYLQTLNFNPITSFLFTLDFFIIVLNIYAMVCVISQFQEYLEGRGTAAFESVDRNTVQYTVTAQQTTTTSSALSGRRRSAGRPMPSRCDPEEFSEAPTKIIIPRPLTAESSEPRPQNSKSILNKSKLPQRSNLNYKPVIGNVSVSNVGDGPEARDFDPRARGRGLQTDENRLPPRPKPKCQHVTAIVNVVRGRQGPDVQKSGYRAKSSGLQSDKNSPTQRFNLDSQNVTTNVNLVKGRDGPEPKESEPRAGGSGLQNASVLSRPSRSAVKKHVQFPDEQSCIEEATEAPIQPGPTEKPGEKYFPKCPCQCHILPRGARHLLIVDGIGVRGASAGALTASQRAVLPARFPSSERATENVRSRSAARRRF